MAGRELTLTDREKAIFYGTKLWGRHGPSTTIVVFFKDNKIVVIVGIHEKENQNDQHAEDLTLEHLDTMDTQGLITLRQNYSPCHRCAQRLVTFCKTRNIKMKLSFVGLYKPEVDENRNGLHHLKTSGIGLSTFHESDWMALKIPVNQRKIVNKQQKQQLKTILKSLPDV